MKKVHSQKAPAAIGPYSQAIVSGGIIYVSGQLPIDPATGEMPKDASSQAEQSLKNIKAILEEGGSSMGKVLRCGIFLADMNDFAAVNEAYARFFSEPYPARSTVQVARLPKDALVEIDCIAASEPPAKDDGFR